MVISLIISMLLNDYSSATTKLMSPKSVIASVSFSTENHFLGSSKLENLSQSAPQLNKKVLHLALTAYQNAHSKGAVKKPVLTVIDYSIPSNQKRMFIFDMKKNTLLYKTFVAHGKNSGRSKVPTNFSNVVSSKASSLGTFITQDTYVGHRGYSLNLKGLEAGFNDKAYDRRVVVHGAPYVEPGFIKKQGRAGVSWGCPAIGHSIAKPVINAIKHGSVVFSYFPDRKFLSKSKYLAA